MIHSAVECHQRCTAATPANGGTANGDLDEELAFHNEVHYIMNAWPGGSRRALLIPLSNLGQRLREALPHRVAN
jgi:hypothetical protein